MNSLMNYGSDDDNDDNSQDRKSASSGHEKGAHFSRTTSEADVNYEEVQMDLSEDSNGSTKNEHKSREFSRNRCEKRDHKDRREDRPNRESSPRRDEERQRDRDSRNRDDKDKDRHRGRDDKYRDKDRSRDGERNRNRERSGDAERSKETDKNRDGERNRDGDRYRDGDRIKDSRDKYREERKRKSRSTSRERRSRSPPARKDYRRRSRTPERANKTGGYSRRYDRATNKMAQLEKLGIEIKAPEGQYTGQRNPGDGDKDRFFMPGITGRFKDQIERRKLLWQKKEPEKIPAACSAPQQPPPPKPGASRSEKVWETTTFAQDQDGKVANKFKRLMGIREASSEGPKGSDVLKKQEEMFHSMEQQYEVARTATHTMRGVGLGFGSFQR